jgi:hypothetical protein
MGDEAYRRWLAKHRNGGLFQRQHSTKAKDNLVGDQAFATGKSGIKNYSIVEVSAQRGYPARKFGRD